MDFADGNETEEPVAPPIVKNLTKPRRPYYNDNE